MARGGLPRRRLDQQRTPMDSGPLGPGTSGTFKGRLVIIYGPTGAISGLFEYAPGTTPKLGNPPVYSITNSNFDPFGNAVRSGGATSYALGNPNNFVQVNNAAVQFSTSTGGAILEMLSGLFQITSNDVYVNGTTFVAPTNDTSGNSDTTNIAAALAQGCCVLAASATPYYTNGPIRMLTNSTLEGNGAVIKPGSNFSAGGSGMVILDSSTVTGTLVRDVTLLDNYAAHDAVTNGVYYSTSTSVPNNKLRGVTARGFLGNGIVCTASAGSASAHLTDCFAYGNMGDGFQLTSDQLVINCEAGFNFGHGFHLLSGASNVYLANCLAWYSGVNPQTSIWPASGTSCGYFLEAPTQYSHLVGCHAQQNGLHGYAIGATSGTAGFCYECSVTGCGADTNSAYGAGNVGSGIFVSGVQSCVIANNVGGNNGGLSPGSQLWGIQAPGGLVATLFHGNTIFGSSAAPNSIASRWNTLTLINGWAVGTGATPKWSFTDTPPNTVLLIGTLDGSAATSNVFAIMPASGVGLPVRPQHGPQMFPLNDTTLAAAGQFFGQVDTSGNLTVQGGTIANKYTFNGSYSIDL